MHIFKILTASFKFMLGFSKQIRNLFNRKPLSYLLNAHQSREASARNA